jgi:Cft2 family RNA processing exonuclease
MNISVLKNSSDSICILLCIDGMNLLLDCGLDQEDLDRSLKHKIDIHDCLSE